MQTGIIREYRKKKKLSQKELAAKMGIAQNVLSNYESGKSNIERMPIREFMILTAELEIPDEFIYLDQSQELDQKIEELGNMRVLEQETLSRKRRITKYLSKLTDAPVSEGRCLAINRVNAGYQAKEMAFLLDILPPAYNRYENDKRKIPYGIAVKVAYILDKKFEEIFELA